MARGRTKGSSSLVVALAVGVIAVASFMGVDVPGYLSGVRSAARSNTPDLGVTQTVGEVAEPAKFLRVVDGDTIMVELHGQKQHVRLIGINAPESVSPQKEKNTPEGKAASQFLEQLMQGHDTVYLVKDKSDTDKFDRLLRYVWLDSNKKLTDYQDIKDSMVNAILVEKGYAQPKEYKPDIMYSEVFEQIAKERS